VINDQGVIGQVLHVGSTTSRVLLITDSSHGIPVRVLRNDLRAIASGSGELDKLELRNLPRNTDVQVGDLLVTSGLGGRFPEGYPVATVTRSDYVEGKPFAQIEAKPLVALDRLRYLLLLWTDKKPEVHDDEEAPTPAAAPAAAPRLRGDALMLQPASGRIWIWISILLALSVDPAASFQLEPFRPDWLAMVLIYWALALPHRTNVGTAWVAGLLLDVLLGSTLGVRAMAMAITTYLAAFQFQKIRNFSLWQQALIIGLLSLVGKITMFWAEHLFSRASLNFAYFWSTLTTMLIWPWIFLVLRKVRRRFNIK
jgi:rod shape-determining protein MreD